MADRGGRSVGAAVPGRRAQVHRCGRTCGLPGRTLRRGPERGPSGRAGGERAACAHPTNCRATPRRAAKRRRRRALAARPSSATSAVPLDASADADIELALLPDGRLAGGAVGAGCRLARARTAAAGEERVAVDITILGCRDARFNARYAGHLDADPCGAPRCICTLSRRCQPVTADGYREPSMATIDATLRR
ncbi:MAG: hypothetical protein MZW92_56595 [Comamonadaceae bacterium]|nr:hypothetical protein [Comamonadaceae bacterium]